MPFECISRAERVDDGVADALARLGCFRLWIGSESGSRRVLEAMDRRMTAEQVQSATLHPVGLAACSAAKRVSVCELDAWSSPVSTRAALVMAFL